jgi:hypothetical protein
MVAELITLAGDLRDGKSDELIELLESVVE